MKKHGLGQNSLRVSKLLCAMDKDHPLEDMRRYSRSSMNVLVRVCEDDLWEHECVTEPNVLWKENEILKALNHDLEVPCPLQW